MVRAFAWRRAAFILLAVAFLVPRGSALLTPNDAGSGLDAGGITAPLGLSSFDTYQGNLTHNDIDAYSIGASGPSPLCVSESVAPTNDVYAVFGVRTPSTNLTMRGEVQSAQQVGFAMTQASSGFLALLDTETPSGEQSPYTFSFGLTTVGALAWGDAGSTADAGDSAATALPVGAGCTGGRLGVLDQADAYTVPLSSAYTFISLATSAPGVSATLTDSAGNVLGSTFGSGTLLAVDTNGGVGTLVVSSSGSSTDLGYLLGIGAGDPPNPGCRPFCFFSS